jgi:hypothetical protein
MNFEMRFKDINVFRLSDLANMHQDAFYVLDEIHTIFPPRNNFSVRNRLLDDFVTQSAKLSIDLLFCSQLYINLPSNTRKLVNFKTDCKKNMKLKRFEYTRYEMYDEEAQSFTKLYLSFKDAEKYFQMFDTHQVYTSNIQMSLMCLTNEELRKKAVEYVDIIKKRLKTKKKNFQVNEIKSILISLNLEFTTELASLVTTLLKYETFLRKVTEC